MAGADEAVAAASAPLDRAAERIQRRILASFRAARVSEGDLGAGTGYGYGDRAREAVETVYAHAFGAEKALVRPQIVSGTHALAIALQACLQPGSRLLSVTGPPYDTLRPVIGPGPASLIEAGVGYAEVNPWQGGRFDLAEALRAVHEHRPQVALVQRSRGYSMRPALPYAALTELCGALLDAPQPPVILVDNCYAEFVEAEEPTACGADLACGSLIKNPGGGIAPAGGYIVGRAELVEKAAVRLFAPGLGSAVGPALVPGRMLLQGLFLAPALVATAAKVALYAAALFSRLGFAVEPGPTEPRSDIIQAIRLGQPELVEAFCRAIQAWSPVDSAARPEFAAMPGYDHRVIMAAGTFVQGASLELSADAPDRPPYWVFLQGGLGLGYGKAAVEAAAAAVLAAGGGGSPSGGRVGDGWVGNGRVGEGRTGTGPHC
jgi:cystathionine beta-lyase family protein involved in aluminum resistance